jgi:hypothetical protein
MQDALSGAPLDLKDEGFRAGQLIALHRISYKFCRICGK